MKTVIVTDIPRADLAHAQALAGHGVATVHEAQGRTGYLGPDIVARQAGTAVAGTAVTVLCWPGDNLMIHAAVEQCRQGDVLVVTTTSSCTDGVFGELLATSLRAHGVVGAVFTAGVRDVRELREMGFPVWSAAVSAQGTVKATAGAVNIPISIGGQIITPGDVIVADDDGVVVVPRADTEAVAQASEQRADKERKTRAASAAGELGLDRYALRTLLADLGVEYVTAEAFYGKE